MGCLILLYLTYLFSCYSDTHDFFMCSRVNNKNVVNITILVPALEQKRSTSFYYCYITNKKFLVETYLTYNLKNDT